VSGRLIVGFTSGTSHERAASLVQDAGARIQRRLDRIGALLINILTVAAIDATGALASFSNYGATSVDPAAPGAIKASVVPDAALAGKTVTGDLLNLDGARQHAG